MTCTMFLSMWISNTAATALMVPIVDSIAEAMYSGDDDNDDVEDTEKKADKETQKSKEFETRRNLMLLACAYSANIGGTGVITGE